MNWDGAPLSLSEHNVDDLTSVAVSGGIAASSNSASVNTFAAVPARSSSASTVPHSSLRDSRLTVNVHASEDDMTLDALRLSRVQPASTVLRQSPQSASVQPLRSVPIATNNEHPGFYTLHWNEKSISSVSAVCGQ